MTAIEFLQVCAGVGIVMVCSAQTAKILSEIRTKVKVGRDTKAPAAKTSKEPLDPLGKQLQEFQGARFGRPMADPVTTPRRSETWPVLAPRLRSVTPPPLPASDPKKNLGKKQGGK